MRTRPNMEGSTKATCRSIANTIGHTYHFDQRMCESLYHFFLVQRRRDPKLIMHTDMMLKVHAYVATLPGGRGR